uniref:Endocuticle structural glycoprotein SgAbd-2 n=1 Tax=Anopheles coluzzii TaxID=1518534 RepID=A0A8W7P7X2_ANOCL
LFEFVICYLLFIMKVFLLATLVAACSCARLDNNYLPPPGAAAAGGGPGLTAPSPGGGSRPAVRQVVREDPEASEVQERHRVVVASEVVLRLEQDLVVPAQVPVVSEDKRSDRVELVRGGPAAGRPGTPAPAYGPPSSGFGGGAPSSFGGGSGAPSGGFSSGGSGFGGGAPGAAPAGPSQPPIEIISYENMNNGDGTYKYSYETANGIKVQEQGEIKNKGSDNEIPSVQGSYSYTAPDGQVITVTYIADENGFQPQGDHLPTPPPIPAEIQKGLDAIAAAQAAGGSAGGPGGPSGAGGYPGAGKPSQGYPGSVTGSGGYPSGAGGPGATGPAGGRPGQGGYPSGPAGGSAGYPAAGGPAAPGGGAGYPSGGPGAPAAPRPSAPGRPSGNGSFNPQSGYQY